MKIALIRKFACTWFCCVAVAIVSLIDVDITFLDVVIVFAVAGTVDLFRTQYIPKYSRNLPRIERFLRRYAVDAPQWAWYLAVATRDYARAEQAIGRIPEKWHRLAERLRATQRMYQAVDNGMPYEGMKEEVMRFADNNEESWLYYEALFALRQGERSRFDELLPQVSTPDHRIMLELHAAMIDQRYEEATALITGFFSKLRGHRYYFYWQRFESVRSKLGISDLS